MEFSARQILLNAEFTPVSSPDQSQQSPSVQTESDSAGFTPFAETPNGHTTTTEENEGRQVLGDVTSLSNNNDDAVVEEKKKRGRPKGWRKPQNPEKIPMDRNQLEKEREKERERRREKQRQKEEQRERQCERQKQRQLEKQRKRSGKEEDQWSVRMRASIKDTMLEHLAKGISRSLSPRNYAD